MSLGVKEGEAKPIYTLRSVVYHKGVSLYGGHYTVAVGIKETGYLFNDDAEVVKCDLLKEIENAYILTYSLDTQETYSRDEIAAIHRSEPFRFSFSSLSQDKNIIPEKTPFIAELSLSTATTIDGNSNNTRTNHSKNDQQVYLFFFHHIF